MEKRSTDLPCAKCGKVINVTNSRLKTSKTGDIYCSRSCSASLNNRRFKKWINHPRFKDGKTTYRRIALHTYGTKCQNPNCVITKSGIEIPTKLLDVDHIDENRKNNHLSNLQVLCVWCHAIKTRKINQGQV